MNTASREPDNAVPQSIDWEKVGRMVSDQCEALGLGVKAAARTLDIEDGTAKTLMRGQPVAADVFVKACLWLEADVGIFLGGHDG